MACVLCERQNPKGLWSVQAEVMVKGVQHVCALLP